MHWITPSQVQELALGFLGAFFKNSWGSCQPTPPPSWGTPVSPPLLPPQRMGTELFLQSLLSLTSLLRVHFIPLCIHNNAKLDQCLFHSLRNTNGPNSCLPTLWLICLVHISDLVVRGCERSKVFLKSWSGKSTAFPTSKDTATIFSQKVNSLGTLLKIHDGSSQSPSYLLCWELPYCSKPSHWEMFSLRTKDTGVLGKDT